MGKLKHNQSGFGAVETVIIIVIVGLLAAVGWLVYDRNNKDNNDKQEVSSTTQQANNTNTTGYFEINEWGVKFKTNDQLDGLYYVYTGEKQGTTGSIVDFSVVALKGTDCAIDKTSQFRLVRYSQAEVDALKDDTSDMATAIKAGTKLGDYYYVEQSNNDVCSQDSTVQATANEFRNGLTEEIPSTLQLN